MKPILAKSDWTIRREGEDDELMTEAEMRRELTSLPNLDGIQVRQGTSRWIAGSEMLRKLQTLDREGVYLKTKGQVVGPFTARRAHEVLEKQAGLDRVEGKIGRKSPWHPAEKLLAHFRRLSANGEAETASKQASDSKGSRGGTIANQLHRDARRIAQSSTDQSAPVNQAPAAVPEPVSAPEPEEIVEAIVIEEPIRVVAKPIYEDQRTSNQVAGTPQEAAGSASAATNPYAVPSASSRYPAKRARRSGGPSSGGPAMGYSVPGFFIAAWGLLMLVASVIRLVMLTLAVQQVDFTRVDKPRLFGLVAGAIVGFTLGTVMLSGGIQTIRRTGLSLARTSAVIAAIPLFGCFAFPFGIWACIKLFGKDAPRDFGC